MDTLYRTLEGGKCFGKRKIYKKESRVWGDVHQAVALNRAIRQNSFENVRFEQNLREELVIQTS